MRSRHVILRADGLAVIERVCRERGLRVDYVLSRYKYQPLVDARRAIAEELRSMDWSTPQVGALLHRDHSTIVQLTAPAPNRARRTARQAKRERVRIAARVAA